MDTLCKPNFMFLGFTVYEKNAMITCKNSNLHNCPNKQLRNFANRHRIFLRYCVTEELEISLYINKYGYFMQTEFHVSRSHSFREN